MNYLNEQKRTLSFRRLPFAAKRRRARPLVAVARRALKAAFVVVPLLVGAVWFVASDRFGLEEVQTRGIERVTSGWIEQQVAPVMGKSLLLTDLVPLRSTLESHPWVSSLRLKKELPGRLLITVDEHVPAAILDSGRRFLLSRRGEQIVALDDPGLGQTVELPPLLVVDRAQALGAEQLADLIGMAQSLNQSATPWARTLTTVRVLSPEDVELDFSEAPFAVRARSNGLSTDLEQRLATVHDLLPQLEDRLGRFKTIDLRFERRIVLLPAASETGLQETTVAARLHTRPANPAAAEDAALVESRISSNGAHSRTVRLALESQLLVWARQGHRA